MGVESGRRLWKSGEEGGFCEREVGERLAEKVSRSGGASLLMGSVVEAIQIGGEDFLFAPL